MMKLTDLPKVVCCLKPWTSEDGKTVLTECEKLIVKGVSRYYRDVLALLH